MGTGPFTLLLPGDEVFFPFGPRLLYLSRGHRDLSSALLETSMGTRLLWGNSFFLPP